MVLNHILDNPVRPCIAQLGPEDKKPSYSLAGIAVEAEVTGVKRFRCETIFNNGWCLGGSCKLFPKRGFGGRAPITGSAEPVLSTNQIPYTPTRGLEVLGLEDPTLDPEVKNYWEKILAYKVHDHLEHDQEEIK